MSDIKNSLDKACPWLLNEWDYEKSGNLQPSDVTAHSKKKVWWKCSKCCYEWAASIDNRSRGSQCPACTDFTNIVIKGKNDLATLFPELIKEWDFEKNDISPYEVSKGSHKNVWWKILYIDPITKKETVLHWRAVIKDRVSGNGCPYITSGKLLKGFNDLVTTNPDVALDWDYQKNVGIFPEQYSAGSHKNVWWKCRTCDTEWKSTIKDRTGGTGCPFCNKYSRTSFPEQAIYFYVKKYYPDAVNTYKDIFDNGMELDIFIPSLKIGLEYDGVYWHHTDGSDSRESLKYSICKNNDIAIIRIKEDINDTSQDNCDDMLYCDFSHKKFYKIDETVRALLLKLGYTSYIDIDTHRDEISIREQYTIGTEESSLKSVYPEIANQWHPTKNGKLRPDMFSPYASYKAWWLCPVCKGEWQASIDRRTSGFKKGKGNCPICTSHMLKKGYNDLESWSQKNDSLILSLWDYDANDKLPDEYFPKSSKSVFWKCDVCGEKWSAAISRATTWTQCPHCWKKSRTKMVQQFDKQGKIIAEYNTAEEAARLLNIDKSAIRRVCLGERSEYKGFIWKYKS